MGVFAEQQIEIADDSVSKYTVVPVPKRNRRNSPSQRSFGGSAMKMVNAFVVLGIVFFLTVTYCDAAALPQTKTSTTPAAVSSVAPTKTTTEQNICINRSPCGWAVYIPFTRKVDYFMRNTCVCPSDKSCIRTDDDLSISAYVYRCGPKQAQEEDLGVPEY